jgi:16S rRNA processing protein RimM
VAPRRVAGAPRRRARGQDTPAAAGPTAAAPGPGAAAPAGRPPEDVELLVVGRIGKPQGLRGEVTVEVRTDDPDARFAPGTALLTDPPDRGPVVVASSRWQGGRMVLALEGVADRTAAEALRGTLLQVDAATVPPPDDEDEFHDHVLRGMVAVLSDGAPLGDVVDVLHLPHGDVLVVRRGGAAGAGPDDAPGGAAPGGAAPGGAAPGGAAPGGAAPGGGAAEVLVPFVRALVPEVDVAARRLVVDPPEGLLDLSGTS